MRRHLGAHATSDEALSAVLEKPVPLIGHHGQRLGCVTRLEFTPASGYLRRVELRTAWQTLELQGRSVRYDESDGVFRLRRRDQSSSR
jgi:hypothetical protein